MGQVSREQFRSLVQFTQHQLASLHARVDELTYISEAQGLAIREELKLEPERLARSRTRVEEVHAHRRGAGGFGTAPATPGPGAAAPLALGRDGGVPDELLTFAERGARQGMITELPAIDLYGLVSPAPPAGLRGRIR